MAKASGILVAIKGGSSFDPRPFLAVARKSIFEYRRQGKKAVVALLGAGDFLGEECLGGTTRRTATAAMITGGSIVRIEKAIMLHLLHTEPRFAELFVSHLVGRKLRIAEDLADQLLNPSEKRLARRLLLLADSSDDNGPKTNFRINQETLAAMVGTTQARVSFFMNKFRRAGFIKYNGDLTVDASLSAFVHE